MGLQNIKGTGLDFVYRFHAWDTCHRGCELLDQSDSNAVQSGLNLLDELSNYGVLGRARLQASLDRLDGDTAAVSADMQLQIESIRNKLAGDKSASDSPRMASSWRTRPGVAWLLSKAEEWFEVQDALRRRHRADQIYDDLRYGRIGRHRAVLELRRINKRQKGGWLWA